MLPYFIVFTILLIASLYYQKVNESIKISIRWICINAFIIFFSFRGDIGDDYIYYFKYYNIVSISNLLLYAPGYGVLNLIFSFFNIPFHCFLVFLSIITNGMLAIFLWNKNINFPLAFLVFFALGGIVNEVDFIRNIICILLFAYSTSYIRKQNYKKFLLLNLGGLLFHYSALIYIPMYWLFQRSMNKAYYAKIMCICFLLSFFKLPLLDFIPICLKSIDFFCLEHIQKYFVLNENQELLFSFGTIERVLTGFAIYYYYDRFKSERYGQILISSYTIYFACYEVLTKYAVLATRFANLYVFCYWLLWPLIVDYQSTTKRRIFVTSIMCFYMICRLIGLSSLPQWKYYTLFN